jgi:ubiquinone/menaquinone biosynthesis C-methylase UbiE
MHQGRLRRAIHRLRSLAGGLESSAAPPPAAAAPANKFIPEMDEWVASHVFTVVDDTVHFSGDIIGGAKVLNVGCGEMLTDFGFLRLNPRSITGIDVTGRPDDHLEQVAQKLRKHGIEVPENYREKISFVLYDGENFPMQDAEFDTVFSWSAFEHVADVPQVLSEIHRVLKPDGKAFIQVYPWYPSLHGSHLSDWVSEPFFHLKRPDDWVLAQLNEAAEKNPGSRDFISRYMWSEYQSLNRISPRDFYKHALDAGFEVVRARVISHDQDLSQAPPGADFADLMIGGTMMLLTKR